MGDDASTIEVELDSINYHGIELGSASLPKAVELNSINLPNDDDDGTICSYLYESMEELATEFVEEKAASKGKVVEGGTVTFDVAARKVTVRTTIEVTREEDFEESWIV